MCAFFSKFITFYLYAFQMLYRKLSHVVAAAPITEKGKFVEVVPRTELYILLLQ